MDSDQNASDASSRRGACLISKRGIHSQIWILVLTVIVFAGGWSYIKRVVVVHQVREASLRQQPRGNLSDLYPRWLGAKEFLLNGRDPYSAEVTREIQAGYYGRPLDSTRANDPKDKAGFAYPLYVAFFLAPTVYYEFAPIQRLFFWLLAFVTVASVILWLRLLKWDLSPVAQLSVVGLSLSSIAAIQGLQLQQMSLLVAGLLALALALLISDYPWLAGIVLAAATIKPQLTVLLLLWLTIWTIADWRRRYQWAASFAISLAVLITLSDWYLPHWVQHFWQGIRDYQNYTGAASVTDNFLGTPLSWLLELVALAATVIVGWRARHHPANKPEFILTATLLLAVTVLMIPTSAQYNQVLLIPALLVLVRERTVIRSHSLLNRVSFVLTMVLVAWPWIASTILAGISFIVKEDKIDRAWAVPLWTTIQIPIAVALLILLHRYQSTIDAPATPASS